MALEFNISQDDHWFVGNDITIPFVIYADDNREARQDLTGFELLWHLKRNADDQILLFKTTDDDISVTDALAGEGELTIPGADTADFGEGYYEHAMIRSNTPVSTLWFGKAYLNKAAAP